MTTKKVTQPNANNSSINHSAAPSKATASSAKTMEMPIITLETECPPARNPSMASKRITPYDLQAALVKTATDNLSIYNC